MTTVVSRRLDAAAGGDAGLPPGVAAADNEVGWQQALHRLGLLVETAGGPA